jgi:predicted TIM-barrel fold metal-dependent hydrolase
MIIDSHHHIFPFLGGTSGFSSVAEHMRFLQLYMVGHGQPVRRVQDDRIVTEPTLAAPDLSGPDGLWDVDFRVTRNGRFEWTRDGIDYYIHFMPPSLQTQTSPTDFVLAQMAYVDVDVAVLQNAHIYGRLNDEFADAVQKHPGKFIGLAEVDEARADSDAELRKLRRAIVDQGLKGLYYANRGFFFDAFRRNFDDPAFEPFWELVRELRIPVFWEFFAVPTVSDENHQRELARLNRWADRYPDIPSIYTHGIDPRYLLGAMPDELARLLRREQFWVEILYPIGWGRLNDYPYPELRPAIKVLHRLMGRERLCWGSDMPNVERYCTYRQSLDYFRKYCDFIPATDMDLILGENLARLFDLA